MKIHHEHQCGHDSMGVQVGSGVGNIVKTDIRTREDPGRGVRLCEGDLESSLLFFTLILIVITTYHHNKVRY